MFDFADIWTTAGLITLGQVVLIDLTMAGDNVVIIGTLAARLPDRLRQRAILFGVAIALVFLIGFALVATQLLQLTGLLLGGGLLLLWVAFNLYREIRPADDSRESPAVAGARPGRFLPAAVKIAVADLSTSLDNVLAVAATAREHPAVLFVGLALSVTLVGFAANLASKLIRRFRWIAWAGLAMILYVAVKMIWEGAQPFLPAFRAWIG